MKMYENAAKTLRKLKAGLLSKHVDENRIALWFSCWNYNWKMYEQDYFPIKYFYQSDDK